MLVQRWARNDNGKKCSRAKLKPVGIEIIDDNEHGIHSAFALIYSLLYSSHDHNK